MRAVWDSDQYLNCISWVEIIFACHNLDIPMTSESGLSLDRVSKMLVFGGGHLWALTLQNQGPKFQSRSQGLIPDLDFWLVPDIAPLWAALNRYDDSDVGLKLAPAHSGLWESRRLTRSRRSCSCSSLGYFIRSVQLNSIGNRERRLRTRRYSPSWNEWYLRPFYYT